MNKIEYITCDNVRKPLPLQEYEWYWYGDTEYKKITRIEVLYHENIYEEYVERGSIRKDELGFLTATRVTGKKITINPNRVGEIEDFTMATHKYRVNGYKTRCYSVLIEDGKEITFDLEKGGA